MAATLLLLLASAAVGARLGELARRDTGDIFTIIGEECNAAQCAEHGARTGSGVSASGECACACPQRAPLFREDRELCVDDLPECSLATFGTGATVQRIPFVYLPLKGQIIHPSREITFTNVKTPICAVSGAQFLTRKGFLDLRNTLDADVPFNLFRDEGKTFLQWSGEDEVRARMTGRVMVVRLLCRDVAATPTSPLDLRGVFTPCVAFRVQGTPPKSYSNVTEVQFAPNAQTSESSQASGLTVSEYVAIGLSSLLLGLVYVASVFLFLHIRKRRKTATNGDIRRLKGLKKKDGSIITERDIIRVNNERMPIVQEDGVVKKNPLLSIGRTVGRQLVDIKLYPNDSGGNLSDLDEFGDSSTQSDDNLYTSQTTSAVIHQPHGDLKLKKESPEVSHRDESGIERLPDEHVSIVETTDDREIARPVGTTRRKLYFNPAYFEPQLMAEPPPAALEFLAKIREVISIAKHKMAAKRFQPILNEIPEEETLSSNGNSINFYHGMGSQRSGSVVSLKRENSRKKTCVGCPGCKVDNDSNVHNVPKYNIPICANCLSNNGDKQNSIRQWLENLPALKQHPLYNDLLPSTQNNLADSLLSLPTIENQKVRKQNRFSSSNCVYLADNLSMPKKSSTLSVRSEPLTRSYNLPFPDFGNFDFDRQNYNDYNLYAQTVAQIDDIRPIGFNDYRAVNTQDNSVHENITHTFTNHNSLPDMVNEAIAREHCTKSYNPSSSSDDERFTNRNRDLAIRKGFLRRTAESLSGNDYETDSLERGSNKKVLSSPTAFTDISSSSQASPSLSTALPLEEELTMRNAVYKLNSGSDSNTSSPYRDIHADPHPNESMENGNGLNISEIQKLTNTHKDYSLVTEVYVNNNYNFESAPSSPSGSDCSMGGRKLGTITNEKDEKPGCLTIEVKDPPENYIKIHESDGFEPDTLDRKHPKYQMKEASDTKKFNRKELIKSLNDNEIMSIPSCIQVKGTFSKPSNRIDNGSKFNSLRNEYGSERPKLSLSLYSGSKSLEVTQDDWQEEDSWLTEEGRILTLELRHSKRQRQCTPPTIKQIKKLSRPDVLPPLPPSDEDPIYEQPVYPPRRVETDKVEINEVYSKNFSGRSLSPRLYTNIATSEHTTHDSSTTEPNYGASYTPVSASVQAQSSEYENVESINNVIKNPDSLCRTFSKKSVSKESTINTDTFVKSTKNGHSKARFRRKKGLNIQDSGYLSSDSTGSRQVLKKVVVAKIVSCSESDDTENEARSESGAESVETHSVCFDSFRKMTTNVECNYSLDSKSSRDSSRNLQHSDDCL